MRCARQHERVKTAAETDRLRNGPQDPLEQGDAPLLDNPDVSDATDENTDD